VKVLSFAYAYGYRDILAIPLNDLDWIMEDALKIYELKMLFYRAVLAFLGVKK
jgi:hypothetical protein